MKKILIFSLSYYPRFTGGAEPAIKEITDRIDDIEFHMITNWNDSTLPKEEKIGNVFVHRIGVATKEPTFEELSKFPLQLNKPLYQFLAALKALSLHRKYKFDATWAMMAHSAGVPAVLFKLVKPKIPFILTLQEGDTPEYVEKVMKPLWPLFIRAFTKADVVQVISTFLGEWAKRRGVPEDRLELVYNGANPKNLYPEYTQEEVEELKKKLGKKEGDIYLLNASRLVHQKANDDTIRAISMLPENVHLILIGAGEDEGMLRELVKELNVESRVKFIGRIDRTEVPKYRNTTVSDIYVTPSRSEGLQLSSLSAMAGRLPLISTQEGGLSEYVFDEKKNPGKETTAWVVDKDSPEQIAEAVKDILANPEKVKAVTERSHKMVFEKFNWDNIAKVMREKVFGKVI